MEFACYTSEALKISPRRFYYATTMAKDFMLRLVYAYDDTFATLIRPKRRSCAYVALLDRFYIRCGLTGLAAAEHQPSKNMDQINQMAILQLAIMNRRVIRLDDEIQTRRRRRAERFWVRPWFSKDRRFQFGHYDQLMRELRTEDSTSFFSYMRMEPHMLVLESRSLLSRP